MPGPGPELFALAKSTYTFAGPLILRRGARAIGLASTETPFALTLEPILEPVAARRHPLEKFPQWIWVVGPRR